jgi:4-amino-4-deoxy-L-arabinose transferase-like glycosyltransferase
MALSPIPFRSTWLRRDRAIDGAWAIGLILVALPLFLWQLGEVPLRDWDESLVAAVARDLWRGGLADGAWLHPTIYGEPYLNKPPLMHWLIALSYHLGGVSEWTTRLPGALLSVASVPLLYGVGRLVLPTRRAACLGALVYLTLLPVVRHGRLAMLDGAIVCFFLGMLLSGLRARNDRRWTLGMGLCLGAMCLTKGVLGLLLGGLVLGFLAWDTPRLLRSPYGWCGLALGLLPVVTWYGVQFEQVGDRLWSVGLVDQSLARVWQAVEGNQGPPWYYVQELLKSAWPWLLFLPWGAQQVWQHRNLSYGRLLLVWPLGYGAVISLMGTKLPWYGMPLYPALALVVGLVLADAQVGSPPGGRHTPYVYPWAWAWGAGLLTIVGLLGLGYIQFNTAQQSLLWPIGFVTATMLLGLGLLCRRDGQFVAVLLWGWYVGLLLLVNGPDWSWELNYDFDVRPVAQLVQTYVPPTDRVYLVHPVNRPSLSFYSDHLTDSLTDDAFDQRWQGPLAYFLINAKTLANLQREDPIVLGSRQGWYLVSQQHPNRLKPPLRQPKPGLDSSPDSADEPVLDEPRTNS